MKHDGFLRRYPIFTAEEFRRHLSATGEPGSRTQEAVLTYYRTRGRLALIRRGLYAVIPPDADAETYLVDPFLIASKLTDDAVLSHHTALEYHGRAYSLHAHVTYSASRPLAAFSFRNHLYRGTHVPKTLLLSGSTGIGVLTAERMGVDLRVTSLERTFVDVLDRPDLVGSWEEICRSLASIEFLNLDALIAYVTLLGNATTAARVGFLLEQQRDALMIGDHHLAALQELRPRQPRYLDRSRRIPGRLLPRWNLVVPADVLHRAWEGLQ